MRHPVCYQCGEPIYGHYLRIERDFEAAVPRRGKLVVVGETNLVQDNVCVHITCDKDISDEERRGRRVFVEFQGFSDEDQVDTLGLLGELRRWVTDGELTGISVSTVTDKGVSSFYKVRGETAELMMASELSRMQQLYLRGMSGNVEEHTCD